MHGAPGVCSCMVHRECVRDRLCTGSVFMHGAEWSWTPLGPYLRLHQHLARAPCRDRPPGILVATERGRDDMIHEHGVHAECS